MTQVKELYNGMIDALGVENLSVPTACVKFYKQGDEIPAGVRECEPQGLTLDAWLRAWAEGVDLWKRILSLE